MFCATRRRVTVTRGRARRRGTRRRAVGRVPWRLAAVSVRGLPATEGAVAARVVVVVVVLVMLVLLVVVVAEVVAVA